MMQQRPIASVPTAFQLYKQDHPDATPEDFFSSPAELTAEYARRWKREKLRAAMVDLEWQQQQSSGGTEGAGKSRLSVLFALKDCIIDGGVANVDVIQRAEELLSVEILTPDKKFILPSALEAAMAALAAATSSNNNHNSALPHAPTAADSNHSEQHPNSKLSATQNAATTQIVTRRRSSLMSGQPQPQQPITTTCDGQTPQQAVAAALGVTVQKKRQTKPRAKIFSAPQQVAVAATLDSVEATAVDPSTAAAAAPLPMGGNPTEANAAAPPTAAPDGAARPRRHLKTARATVAADGQQQPQQDNENNNNDPAAAAAPPRKKRRTSGATKSSSAVAAAAAAMDAVGVTPLKGPRAKELSAAEKKYLPGLRKIMERLAVEAAIQTNQLRRMFDEFRGVVQSIALAAASQSGAQPNANTSNNSKENSNDGMDGGHQFIACWHGDGQFQSKYFSDEHEAKEHSAKLNKFHISRVLIRCGSGSEEVLEEWYYNDEWKKLITLFVHDLLQKSKVGGGAKESGGGGGEGVVVASAEEQQQQQPMPSLDALSEAIEYSAKQFEERTDAQECFDEELLHHIAVQVYCVMNALEGFVSLPPQPSSGASKRREKHLQKVQHEKEKAEVKEKARLERQAAKDASKSEKARELEAARSAKAKELEAARAAKAKEARVSRSVVIHAPGIDYQCDGGAVVDERLLRPSDAPLHPLSYIAYDPLPLPAEDYSVAVDVWAMLSSLPRPFKLSQMPLALFLRVLQDDNDNPLVEDIVRGMVECDSEGEALMNMRGRHWFKSAAEFIALSAGVRKKKVAKRAPTPVPSSSSSSGSSDSSDDEDDGESGSSSDEEEEEEEEAEEEEGEEEEGEDKQHGSDDGDEKKSPTSQQAAAPEQQFPSGPVGDLLAEMKSIGPTYLSWLNLNVHFRLIFLQTILNRVLDCDSVVSGASAVQHMVEHDTHNLEKRCKDMHEAAEKDLRAALRAPAPPPPKDAAAAASMSREEVRNTIVNKAEKQISSALAKVFRKWDGDDYGCRIRYLGRDRYNRFFWRFPQETRIFVQTVAGETDEAFPMLPPPIVEAPALPQPDVPEKQPDTTSRKRRAVRMLIDDIEEAPPAKAQKTEGTDAEPQRQWGVISTAHLHDFIESLHSNGKREGPLKHSLLVQETFLQEAQPSPYETQTPGGIGIRMTRSRNINSGFVNRLRPTMLD